MDPLDSTATLLKLILELLRLRIARIAVNNVESQTLLAIVVVPIAVSFRLGRAQNRDGKGVPRLVRCTDKAVFHSGDRPSYRQASDGVDARVSRRTLVISCTNSGSVMSLLARSRPRRFVEDSARAVFH